MEPKSAVTVELQEPQQRSAREPKSAVEVELQEPQQRHPQQTMPLLEEHDLLHVVHVVPEHVVQLFLRVQGESAGGILYCTHHRQCSIMCGMLQNLKQMQC